MAKARDRNAVVLVGHEDDEHSDQLQALLVERSKVPVIRWSRNQLPQATFSYLLGGIAQVDLSSLGPFSAAGFWRRPSWPALGDFEGAYVDFATDECVDAFDGALEALGITWLTEPQALRRAELKILQLATALELGIQIPATIVTNSSGAATEFARRVGPVVAKPVRYGLVANDPHPFVAFATQVGTKDLRFLEGPPVIVQERIVAFKHLRVVTAGSFVFVAELRTDTIDWRSELENHQRFERSQGAIWDRVEVQALAIAKRLAIGYSSQDWILTNDDRLVFLEANPNGQWLFLDHLWGGGITGAIAETLEVLALGIRAGGTNS